MNSQPRLLSGVRPELTLLPVPSLEPPGEWMRDFFFFRTPRNLLFCFTLARGGGREGGEGWERGREGGKEEGVGEREKGREGVGERAKVRGEGSLHAEV